MAKPLAKAELARQELFCNEYVFNGNNATQAYLTAYPKSSYNAAKVSATRLLTKANLRSRIAEIQGEHHDSLIADHKKVLREVSDLALFDPREMFDDDGRLLNLHEMNPVTRKSVNEVEIILGDDDGIPFRMAKVKYGKDKKGYLDMMMKHYNQYEAHRVAGSVQPMTVWLHPADKDL